VLQERKMSEEENVNGGLIPNRALDLALYPDECLLTPAKEVFSFGHDLKQLVTDMGNTLHLYSGLGLACPQVGIPWRICIIHDFEPSEENESQVVVLINPKILKESGEQLRKEGCLSFPGVFLQVKRPKKLTVQCQDAEGREHFLEVTGLEAALIQHEIDHLDGKTFLDRMSSLQRRRALQKLKRNMKTIYRQSRNSSQ
jgi:peptide deformylase